jgi:predicted permease
MLQRALQEAPPAFRHEIRVGVRDLRQWQTGDRRKISWVLLASVLSVLLLACMNVATLLLARAAGRQRELAMREALGARRTRLARQALTESLLLGLIGGLCGTALAFALLRVVLAFAPQGGPGVPSVHIDPRALVAALLVSFVSGLLFGIVPSTRLPGLEALTGWRSTSPTRTWIRSVLVTAQIAGSLLMMTAAGLMLRTLWRLERVPLGLDATHVVSAEFTLGNRYDGPRAIGFSEQLERSLRAQPGIGAVAVSDTLPPSGRTRTMPFFVIHVAGRPPFENGVGGMVPWRAVSSGYFRTLGIPLLRGRGFTDSDAGSHERVIVLSDALARRLFPSGDPVGGHVGFNDNQWFTVIGIAADVRNRGLAGRPDPEFYLDRDQRPDMAVNGATIRHVAVVVRSVLDRAVVAPLLRERVHQLDPAVPVETAAFDDRVAELTTAERFHAVLFSAFAVIALLLAVSGLYGLVAFLVAQRRQEIGVRIALGASPATVAAMVVGSALRFAALGAACGLLAAMLMTHWLAALLYGVSPRDPLTLAVAAIVLIASAIAAALAPSLTAARTDPMVALRAE